MRFLILAIVLSFGLGACGLSDPRYETQYSLTAPKSAQGRQCAVMCHGNRQTCAANVSAETRQCTADNRQNCRRRARSQFRSCLDNMPRGTTASARDIQRAHHSNCRSSLGSDRSYCDRSSFRRECRPNTDCAADYRQCFKLCGGDVLETRVCVKNCDKAK